MKTFQFKDNNGLNHEAYFLLLKYPSNDRLSVIIMARDNDGEPYKPYDTISMNNEEFCREDCTYIRECKMCNIREILEENRFAQRTGYEIVTDCGIYPQYEFDMENTCQYAQDLR